MDRIRVLVVDDSAFMRKVISDLLESHPNIQVWATARNGKDALDKLEKEKPDVVTLDVEMPILDGLETLQVIKRKHDLPVIMLSSTTTVGAKNTITALEYGAFDFISKPSGPISLDIHKVKEELIEKVRAAHQLQIEKKTSTTAEVAPRVTLEKTVEDMIAVKQSIRSTNNMGLQHIVLIGSSTGGPKALHQVLKSLPPLDHTAILIVQHMPAAFTKSLAQRLEQQTGHTVKEAINDERVEEGKVYLAPGDHHMELQQSNQGVTVHLHQQPQRSGHRPSVSVLFESAAALTRYHILTITMTGMGKDGTEGLQILRNKKQVYSVAEHKSTCVVYGMPRAAVEADLIDEICPLEHIHETIHRFVKK